MRTMHHDFGLDMEGADHSWIEEQRRRQDPDTNLWNRPRQRVVVPESVLRYGKQGRNLACQPWDVVMVEDVLNWLQDAESEESQATHGAKVIRNARARIFCCEQPHRKGPEAFWDLIELLNPPGMISINKRNVRSPIVRRSPATVVDNTAPPELSYASVAVELSEAEHAFHTGATAYIRNVDPVMSQNIHRVVHPFTGGMTGALMEHPMASGLTQLQLTNVISSRGSACTCLATCNTGTHAGRCVGQVRAGQSP